MKDGDYIIFDIVSPLEELVEEVDTINKKEREKDGTGQ